MTCENIKETHFLEEKFNNARKVSRFMTSLGYEYVFKRRRRRAFRYFQYDPRKTGPGGIGVIVLSTDVKLIWYRIPA